MEALSKLLGRRAMLRTLGVAGVMMGNPRRTDFESNTYLLPEEAQTVLPDKVWSVFSARNARQDHNKGYRLHGFDPDLAAMRSVSMSWRLLKQRDRDWEYRSWMDRTKDALRQELGL